MPLKPNPRRFFRFICGGKYSHKDLNRYSSKIDTTPGLGPKGDCWEWKGGLDKANYGIFSFTDDGINMDIKAHRAAYETATGILIPDGKCVLHECDNPPCCKPNHLRVGTHQDNMQDMINKGRQSHINVNVGENNGRSKLIWAQVKEIRRLYNTGKYTYKQLAKIFNTSVETIGGIILNNVWHDNNYVPPKSKHRKLTQVKINNICELYISGKYSKRKLGKIFGVSSTHINRILFKFGKSRDTTFKIGVIVGTK
jgi:hypothetical protein